MIVDKVEIVSQPVYFLVTQPVRFPLIRSPDPIDVQYQRSESDGEISITGGSHRSDGKNVYRRRNACQLGKHNITMH